MTSNLHHCPDQDRIGQGAWHSLRRAIRAVSFACLCTAIAPLGGRAQGASTGVIAGRVLNPASGEYVRNAQVRVEGTNLSAISEDGGFYRLPGVGPGDVKLVVIYTGYHPATATVHIMPGGTVTRDFELASALQAQPATGGAPITLAVFTVSSEREGNAKAIMQQRNSMDITNSVSSDVFGDVAEGNIGEFLKHMPGVEVDLQQGEARNISLRGLESQYTQVTMDGISLASADALGAGTNDAARAFSVENVSLNSMESIEVSKTVSADVDADAPAGTINLRSKRAFNAAGRRITTQANLTEFSARFNLDDSYGPDDRKSRKIHPGGIFEYSDVLFNKRLGVSLNISESMVYSANARNQITYNYTTTTVPADPRPVVPTQILFLHAPRTNRRSAVTFNADYKATSRLVLSFSLLYNYSRLNNPQRTLRFNTGARDTVVGADPLTSLTTSSPAASVVSSPSGNVKLGQTITAVSRLEYKIGNLTLEGKFAGSNAISWYDPNGRNGEVLDVLSPTLTGLTFTAQRSSLRSADWKIVQTGGPDMADGANYTTTRITSDQGWSNVTDRFSGEITGTLRTTRIVPIVWKAGVKKKFEGREYWRDTDSLRYNLIGAAPLGAWAGYNSPFPYDIGGTNTDASLRSISGGTVFVPDLVRIGTLFREHPERFAHSMSANDYFNAFVAFRRKYTEEIDAAYLVATASLGRMAFRAGLRREATSTDGENFDPHLPAELSAAGFPEANGRATTIPGLQYQFFSKPKIHSKGDYHNLFPSASLKYKFTQNLDFQFGFSSTIRRPVIGAIAGVWLVNDEALTVRVPNPNLTPERSKNFSARLAYYFEPVGIFAVNAFQNNVRGFFITDRLTAQEFGYTGADLAAYEFITTVQGTGEITLRGMEYEYSQSLSFLPAPFNGLNVRASYTHNYADTPKARLIPHSINAGLSYGYRRFNAYANMNWRDNYPFVADGTTFVRHRANLDIGGGFRFTKRINFFFSARNLFNEPFVRMQQVDANPAVSTFYEVTGTNWTFGLKTVW